MARPAHLPGAIPRLRVRRQKSGAVYYYYDHGGRPRRESPLGNDYGVALQAWCRIERTRLLPTAVTPTLRQVLEQYRADAVMRLPPTQQEACHRLLDLLLDTPDAADRPLRAATLQPPTDRSARSQALRELAPQREALLHWCTWMGYAEGNDRAVAAPVHAQMKKGALSGA